MAEIKRDRLSHLNPRPKPFSKPRVHVASVMLTQLPIAISLTVLFLNLPTVGNAQSGNAQTSTVAQVPVPNSPSVPSVQPLPPQDIIPRPAPTPQLPQTSPPPVSPEELLPKTPPRPPEEAPSDLPLKFRVTGFKFEGSTVFKDDALLAAIVKALNLDPATPLPREFTFAELIEARSAITMLYINKGYITSGALIAAEQSIPPAGGTVTIQIVEGSLEDIKVTGTRRLQPGYISSRLAIATQKPLNHPRLLDALQLLSQSPLIDKISAELTAGSQFGSNLLEVTVKEAPTFHGAITLDNNRSPAVDFFGRQFAGLG